MRAAAATIPDMGEAAIRLLDDDAVVLRKAGVRFPIELRPAGFHADDLSTWPEANGRLEWVAGKLLYMPPCADIQQDVAVDVVHILRTWSEAHPEFVVGGNEAGMKLGDDVRAADAALWLRAEVGPSVGRLRHVPPRLAVEVAGQDEDESALRTKAEWYLAHGVLVVWIVLPTSREIVVIRQDGASRHARGERIPAVGHLPDLAPDVSRFFAQLDSAEALAST
jgi:Uma2 family endonuclease